MIAIKPCNWSEFPEALCESKWARRGWMVIWLHTECCLRPQCLPISSRLFGGRGKWYVRPLIAALECYTKCIASPPALSMWYREQKIAFDFCCAAPWLYIIWWRSPPKVQISPKCTVRSVISPRRRYRSVTTSWRSLSVHRMQRVHWTLSMWTRSGIRSVSSAANFSPSHSLESWTWFVFLFCSWSATHCLT